MCASTGAKRRDVFSGVAGCFYRAGWAALAAACWPRLSLAQLRRGERDRRTLEKFGFYEIAPSTASHCWIHACSVGEVGVALRCIAALRASRPGTVFTLTTGTPEGHALASARLRPPDQAAWSPFDSRGAMRRAYDRLRPEFVVLVEVELWPNHLREAQARGIPVFVVNGRMSRRDEIAYRRAGEFMRRVFAIPQLVCARTQEDADRFRSLGAKRTVVSGNMKYDPLPEVPPLVTSPLPYLPDGPILLGASTHEGEEKFLLETAARIRRAIPGLALVIVPRHPRRAEKIKMLAAAHGFHAALGSEAGTAGCTVIDTVGQLPALYAKAAVAFVGKSLTARGGQNFLEAVEAGCPVVMGPHTEHFADAAAAFLAAGAVVQEPDAAGVARRLQDILREPEGGRRMAATALEILQRERGATARTTTLISAALGR